MTKTPHVEEFRAHLLSEARLETLLQSACTHVVAAAPHAEMAGVTLVDENTGDPATVVSTDARVLAIDACQYRTDEGPCLEAARHNRTIRTDRDGSADRWPTFAAALGEGRTGNFLSVPISIDDAVLGSVNVYGYADRNFTVYDEQLVHVVVAALESALWNSRRVRAAQTELSGLREAMRTRATIEQAKGVVMANRGVTADAAFDVLSAQSQNENIKLAVIAERIVRSVQQKQHRIEQHGQ